MKPNFNPTRSRRRGFTVTELMVVIVIIAVLATIGFAVAKRAQAKAKALECLNNVRTWSMVFSSAHLDLGGGLMYCTDNFLSIGPGESPFSLYFAEMVGLDGTKNRNGSPVRDQYDYDKEYKGKIVDLMAEVRSCPLHEVGPNVHGNPGTSYTLNTYLKVPGRKAFGYDVLTTNKLPRLSKKIYMVDCQENGPQNFQAQGKSGLVEGIREVEQYHGGKVNAIFLDMHIEQIDADQLDKDWKAFTQR